MVTALRSSFVAFLLAALIHPVAAEASAREQMFTVLRDGAPVGSHKVAFETAADGAEQVSITTSIVVKFGFIPVYRFEHQGQELWQGGQLVSLASKTNEDGTPHQLAVSAEGGQLKVNGDGTVSSMPLGTIPASLWNPSLVSQKRILNTLHGLAMDVTVTDKGVEQVPVRGNPVSARHYVMDGDLKREIWFDGAGALVKVRFKAKDDSEIVYELR